MCTNFVSETGDPLPNIKRGSPKAFRRRRVPSIYFPRGAEGVFVIESFIGVCAYLACYCGVVFVARSGCVCFCSRKGVLVLGTIVILFADVSLLR